MPASSSAVLAPVPRAVNRPSSTAVSSVLDGQNPIPTCMISDGSGTSTGRCSVTDLSATSVIGSSLLSNMHVGRLIAATELPATVGAGSAGVFHGVRTFLIATSNVCANGAGDERRQALAGHAAFLGPGPGALVGQHADHPVGEVAARNRSRRDRVDDQLGGVAPAMTIFITDPPLGTTAQELAGAGRRWPAAARPATPATPRRRSGHRPPCPQTSGAWTAAANPLARGGRRQRAGRATARRAKPPSLPPVSRLARPHRRASIHLVSSVVRCPLRSARRRTAAR